MFRKQPLENSSKPSKRLWQDLSDRQTHSVALVACSDNWRSNKIP
ncbi:MULTISPECIES: hypothetical protein [Nostocales]|nr:MULTISPECIES: hypothetical protein [Nostocales]